MRALPPYRNDYPTRRYEMSLWNETRDPVQRVDLLQRMLNHVIRQYARDAGREAVGRVALAFVDNGWFTDEEAARVFLDRLDR
jgi:hypothetical protein